MKKFIVLLVLGLAMTSSLFSCVEEDDHYEGTEFTNEIDPGGDLDDPAEPDEED